MGGLQRNVLSGRSLGASKSISQTNTQQPERLSECGQEGCEQRDPLTETHSFT
ncbi:hypothetical protein CRENBAI_016945, partial [Crenichthys baileyi]